MGVTGRQFSKGFIVHCRQMCIYLQDTQAMLIDASEAVTVNIDSPDAQYMGMSEYCPKEGQSIKLASSDCCHTCVFSQSTCKTTSESHKVVGVQVSGEQAHKQ